MSFSLEFEPGNRRHYRAPAQHGEVLSIPALEEAVDVARHNRQANSQAELSLAGSSFSEFRAEARREVFARATEWTRRWTTGTIPCLECANHDALIFATGHQPQLAHAGVWAKNLAIGTLVERCRQSAEHQAAIGLNIVVDNDTVGTQSLLLPGGSPEQPHFQQIAFDLPQRRQPWEELRIQDRELFRSFGDRVTTALAPWEIHPLLAQMWPDAISASEQTERIADCLTVCRLQQERRWGISNLELPLSEICQTESFLKFVSHVILQAEEFHRCYNAVVAAYRQQHRIRNQRHPVPDLETRAGKLELPFWFWRAGEGERGQLFVAREGSRVQIFVRDEVLIDVDPAGLLDELRNLRRAGKLRTRALTTTLFARLFLSDLFVHGIGGAKYDEMTDRLLSQFFGVAPPGFLVLTATLHLPLPESGLEEASPGIWKQRLRTLQFNSERVVDRSQDSAWKQLRQRKRELIEQRQQAPKRQWTAESDVSDQMNRQQLAAGRRERRQQHFELKRVREQLELLAAREIEQARTALQQAEHTEQAKQVLKSREYAGALFPEATVAALLAQLRELASAAPLEISTD